MVTIDQWYNGLCIWGPIHIDRLEGTKHPSIYILLNESEKTSRFKKDFAEKGNLKGTTHTKI